MRHAVRSCNFVAWRNKPPKCFTNCLNGISIKNNQQPRVGWKMFSYINLKTARHIVKQMLGKIGRESKEGVIKIQVCTLCCSFACFYCKMPMFWMLSFCDKYCSKKTQTSKNHQNWKQMSKKPCFLQVFWIFLNLGAITDKRTDLWSRDFLIWKINSGLLAIGLGWTVK